MTSQSEEFVVVKQGVDTALALISHLTTQVQDLKTQITTLRAELASKGGQ